MNGLQETFYIMAIIFMSITFLLLIALVVAVFVIRAKINKIHRMIEDKIDLITNVAERSGELSAKAASAVFKQAQKVIKKSKK